MNSSENETLNHICLVDEPKRSESPPWNPARRICSFMLLVSLICTLIVVGIVLVALLLSQRGSNPLSKSSGRVSPLRVVPMPRERPDNPVPVILASRHLWQPLVKEMDNLLGVYNAHSTNASCGTCRILERLSPNCSLGSRYGFDVGNPCVALLLQQPGFFPHDDRLLYLSCRGLPDIRYSPHRSFSLPPYVHNLAASDYPPQMIMLQLVQPPTKTEISVTCHLRSSHNVDRASVSFDIVVL